MRTCGTKDNVVSYRCESQKKVIENAVYLQKSFVFSSYIHMVYFLRLFILFIVRFLLRRFLLLGME